ALDLAGPRDRTVLFLGRIHPKKGLVHLLEAWGRIPEVSRGWRLRIVGPDEGGHAAELQNMAARLNLEGVSIEPPIYGPAKAAAYAKASLF
ncbi:glycosyltransferase, partial [Acinetobacter baumannii]